MNIHLNHRYEDAIDYWYDGVQLFRYTYQPQTAQLEAPRPFFHPLRTLGGRELTNYRPIDHRWHHGLSMTFAHLSGENFWGGPSYLRDQGYVQLDNNGAQRHLDWTDVRLDDGTPRMKERLVWVTQGGQEWLQETRTIAVARVDLAQGYWMLTFQTQLTNCSGRTLDFGSPTTNGRPAAGYGGLFWRGPRCFGGGRILLADGTEGEEEAMGHRSPWLAYYGRHDGSDETSTLIFCDDPSNPRYPTQWFARNGYAAVVSFALCFDQEYPLADGETLALTHHIAFADGAWKVEQIEALAATVGGENSGRRMNGQERSLRVGRVSIPAVRDVHQATKVSEWFI